MNINKFYVTWLGFGLIKPAPGTWGTVGGTIFYVLFSILINSKLLMIFALILIFISGWYAIEKYQKTTKSHDSGEIVIDEVVGIIITLLFNQCRKLNQMKKSLI